MTDSLVRGFRTWLRWTKTCAFPGCGRPPEPHHVRSRGSLGTSDPVKCDPNNVVPFCRDHHNLGESPGWSWKRVEQVYDLDLRLIARATWTEWSLLSASERDYWHGVEEGLGLDY